MSSNHQPYTEQLFALLQQHAPLMAILRELRVLAPHAYIAAGVLRHLVWAHLHEQAYVLDHTEIDVVFYDPRPQSRIYEQQWAENLTEKFPNIQWDVTNQAWVHLWYRTDQNQGIAPLTSIAHALSLWPETATALAVRLDQNHQLECIAPLGLDDLFELKLRWNPTLVSYQVFERRLLTKQFLNKWSKLRLVNN